MVKKVTIPDSLKGGRGGGGGGGKGERGEGEGRGGGVGEGRGRGGKGALKGKSLPRGGTCPWCLPPSVLPPMKMDNVQSLRCEKEA